jgi:hypothetical protein
MIVKSRPAKATVATPKPYANPTLFKAGGAFGCDGGNKRER